MFGIDCSGAAESIAKGLSGALPRAIAGALGAAIAKALGPSGFSFSVGASRFAYAYHSHSMADPELFSAQAVVSARRRLGLPATLIIPTGPYFSCVPGSPGADSGLRSFLDGL